MPEPDARVLNWRFVVPDEPDGLLLLPVGDEALPGATVPRPSVAALSSALRRSPYPAVAAPDLGSWAALEPTRSALDLLEHLAAAVGPKGWLCVGLTNPWYPGNLFSASRLRPARARRFLLDAGFSPAQTYIALPDQRCPAYLVSSDSGVELDYLLRHLFLPYVGALRGIRARAKLWAVRAMRRLALSIPPRARSSFAPAVLLVAKRST
jgi:hypothetical protein